MLVDAHVSSEIKKKKNELSLCTYFLSRRIYACPEKYELCDFGDIT